MANVRERRPSEAERLEAEGLLVLAKSRIRQRRLTVALAILVAFAGGYWARLMTTPAIVIKAVCVPMHAQGSVERL